MSKKKVKKVKNQDSMGKTNFFPSTLPFSPWAFLATFACNSSLENTGKNELKTHVEQNFTMCSYGVGIWGT
jgi:hypothetical protein